MSPINFDASEHDRPDLAVPLRALRDWFGHHSKSRFIDLHLLGKDLPRVDARQLLDALEYLEQLGALRNSIRLRGPGGVFLPETFDDPEKIPPRVWDRGHTHKIDSDDCEVIFGFQLEEAGGQT